MKKFSFKNICRLFVAFAFVSLTVVTTSCSKEEVNKVVEDTAKSFGNHYDFINAVNAFTGNCDWKETEGYFVKEQGSKDDAISTLRRYTNARMDIPGRWIIDSTNYIVVRPSTNPGGIYDVEIEADHLNEDGSKGSHVSIKVYFIYDKH